MLFSYSYHTMFYSYIHIHCPPHSSLCYCSSSSFKTVITYAYMIHTYFTTLCISLSCFFLSSCLKLDSDSIYEKTNETLLSESVLFHATQWFPNLSVFLQMASFALFPFEVEQNSIRDRCHLFFITLLLIDI